jgi:hypothetical protein
MTETNSTVSTPGRARREDWTVRFLNVYAATGIVRLAATAAGVSRSAPYKKAQSSATFASKWIEAREAAVDLLEAEARRRALTSSDALLMFLLKADRAKFREKVEIKLDVEIEAERIGRSIGVSGQAVLDEAQRILEAGGA